MKLLIVVVCIVCLQPTLYAQSVMIDFVNGTASQTGVDPEGNILDVQDQAGIPGVPTSVAFVDTTGGFGGVSSVMRSQLFSIAELGSLTLSNFESSVSSTFGMLASGYAQSHARFVVEEETVVHISIVSSTDSLILIPTNIPNFGPIDPNGTIDNLLLDALTVECDGRSLRQYIDDQESASFVASGMVTLTTYTTDHPQNPIENIYDLRLQADSSNNDCTASMSSIQINFNPNMNGVPIVSECDTRLIHRFDQNPFSSLAIQDDTILIGDRNAELHGVQSSGAIFAYDRIDGDWIQTQAVHLPITTPIGLGSSVYLEGDTAAVRDDSSRDFHIFERDGLGEWSWIDTIEPHAFSATSVEYGHQVELVEQIGPFAKKTLFVADTRLFGPGAVHQYEDIGSTWIHTGIISDSPGFGVDNFGLDIAVHHDSLIISAPNEHLNTCGNYDTDGAVYSYARDGSIFDFEPMKFGDPAAGIAGQFGREIRIYQDFMAIASPYAQTTPSAFPGSVQMYAYENNQWVPTQRIAPPFTRCQGTPYGFGRLLELSGNNLMIGSQDEGVFWYQYDGANWMIRGQIPVTVDHFVSEIALSGNHLALELNNIWHVYLLDPGPDAPNGLSMYLSSYSTTDLAREVIVEDGIAYIADLQSGVIVLDVSDPSLPFFLGAYDSVGSSLGISKQGSRIYVADGVDGGLLILDVTDPTNPTYVSSYDTIANAVDVTVDGDRVYIADNAGGLQIFDVLEPTAPLLIGEYNTPDSARMVAIDGDIAYVPDGSTGLLVFDVTDPTNPILLYTHDTLGYAQDFYISENFGYLADGTGGLLIFDLSNPELPTPVGFFATHNSGSVRVLDGKAYIADSDEGIKIIDVSDPTNPSLLDSYDTSGYALDVYADSQFAYIADNSDGLHVLKLDNCDSPPICIADLTGDHQLNFLDVSAFLQAYGNQDLKADFETDGVLNFLDVSAFLLAFGEGCQ